MVGWRLPALLKMSLAGKKEILQGKVFIWKCWCAFPCTEVPLEKEEEEDIPLGPVCSPASLMLSAPILSGG